MSASETEAIDPVCGMTVDPNGPRQHVHAGTTYHFCGDRCLARFREDPESFLRPVEERDAPAAAEGVLYTCPMDPEIVRDEPGPCPICGMALEPMTPSATDEESPELADMTRRFLGSLVLTLPVFAIAMVAVLGAGVAAMAQQPAAVIEARQTGRNGFDGRSRLRKHPASSGVAGARLAA